MALRIYQHPRSRIFHVDGTVAGQRIRRSLGTRDPRLAEEMRAATEAAIWRSGEYGGGARAFEEAVIGYLKDGGEARFMEQVLRHFRGQRLDRITPAMIREGAAVRYPKATAATRNRQFIAPASAVINWAHQQGWCGAIRVKRFREATAERRTVGRDWMDRFMSAASPHLGALYLFMHQTGARVSEACRLKWADVDLRAGRAVLRETKNGSPRVCPLTAEMMELLAALPHDGRPVFRYASRGGTYKAIRAACARAGLDYVPPHQAGRHSFATALDAAGFTLPQIADAGGWKTLAQVGTYTHPEGSAERAAETMGRAGLARKRQGDKP